MRGGAPWRIKSCSLTVYSNRRVKRDGMVTLPLRRFPPVTSVRSPHRTSILTFLRDNPPLSRARLSELTGPVAHNHHQSRDPLIAGGLVVEHATAGGRIGRPSIPLTPVPEAVTVAVVQIGVGTLRFRLADGECRVRRTNSLIAARDRLRMSACSADVARFVSRNGSATRSYKLLRRPVSVEVDAPSGRICA